MKKLILIILIFSLATNGCVYDPPLPKNEKFKITNNSKQDIFCYASFENNMDKIPVILNHQPRGADEFLFPILEIPVKRSKSLNGVSVWENFINTNSKDSLIHIFIFSKSLVKENGWKNIISTGEYTKKYVFNEMELEKLDWNIIYNDN